MDFVEIAQEYYVFRYALINITDNYKGDQCSLLELNEMGNYVWNKIGDGCTVNALADQLFKEIVDDVSFQTVLDDVCEFVQALLECRFVEVAEDGR